MNSRLYKNKVKIFKYIRGLSFRTMDYERIKYAIPLTYEINPKEEGVLLESLARFQKSVRKFSSMFGTTALARKFDESKRDTANGSKDARTRIVLEGIQINETGHLDVSAGFNLVVCQTITLQAFVEMISELNNVFTEKTRNVAKQVTGKELI